MEKTEPTPAPGGQTAEAKKEAAHASATLRELLDELVLVFVLVMFLKTFLVEHYKIPSGSMTPTLRGGLVAYVPIDNDPGLVYWSNLNSPPLAYKKHDGRYLLDPKARVDTDDLRTAGAIHEEFDHVLVNRMAYWFKDPRRGDIVVFKVPPSIYKPEAPIYIKRLAGEPGDVLTFARNGRLIANGRPVERPPFYQTQHYLTLIDDAPPGLPQQTDMETHVEDGGWRIDRIHVPPGMDYVFGDNSTPQGSWDSRYWGGVPIENFKGRAFVRVWPLMQAGFLH